MSNLSHCWNDWDRQAEKGWGKKHPRTTGEISALQWANISRWALFNCMLFLFQVASLPQLWALAYLCWNGLVALICEWLILPSSEVKHLFSLHRWTRREKGDRMPLQEDMSPWARGWEFTKYFLHSSLSFLSPHWHHFHCAFHCCGPLDPQSFEFSVSGSMFVFSFSEKHQALLCLEILPVLKALDPSGERKWAA